MDSAADELEMLASRLHEGVRNLLQQEQRRLSGYKNRIPSAAYHRISDAKMALLTVRKDVVQAVTSSLFRHSPSPGIVATTIGRCFTGKVVGPRLQHYVERWESSEECR